VLDSEQCDAFHVRRDVQSRGWDSSGMTTCAMIVRSSRSSEISRSAVPLTHHFNCGIKQHWTFEQTRGPRLCIAPKEARGAVSHIVEERGLSRNSVGAFCHWLVHYQVPRQVVVRRELGWPVATPFGDLDPMPAAVSPHAPPSAPPYLCTSVLFSFLNDQM
jgi:hypothetical protein